ncbi:Pif1p-like protein, partial [Dinothrombium tinctorium]
YPNFDGACDTLRKKLDELKKQRKEDSFQSSSQTEKRKVWFTPRMQDALKKYRTQAQEENASNIKSRAIELFKEAYPEASQNIKDSSLFFRVTQPFYSQEDKFWTEERKCDLINCSTNAFKIQKEESRNRYKPRKFEDILYEQFRNIHPEYDKNANALRSYYYLLCKTLKEKNLEIEFFEEDIDEKIKILKQELAGYHRQLQIPLFDAIFQHPIEQDEEIIDENEMKNKLRNITSASYCDPNLEAKVWPVDFPYGKGSWHFKSKLKINSYLKWRLLSFDDRFRANKPYLFFFIDRMFKSRVFYFNEVRRVRVEGQYEKLKKIDVSDPYSKYGETVPACIPGSRGYCATRTLEFLAVVRDAGRKPDLFYTMTFNGNWLDLQADLRHGHGVQAEKEEPLQEKIPLRGISYSNAPVECAVAWWKRWRDFCKHVLKNPIGPFGDVVRYAYKFEYQKRGPVHVHMIIWCKDSKYPDDVAIAEVPPEDSDAIRRKLRQLVLAFQVHECKTERCKTFSKGKKRKKCKYGYPFALNDRVQLDKRGLTYLHIRKKEEDRNIVSYNPRIMLRYQCHHNVTFCSENGYEAYLTKYVTKSEPNERMFIQGKESAAKIYFQTRVLGAFEAAIIGLQMRQSGTSHEVVYCPTELEPTYRYIKQKKHLPSDDESEDIYYDNLLEKYLDRPKELDEFNYVEFVKKYKYRSDTKKDPVIEIMEIDSDKEHEDDPDYNNSGKSQQRKSKRQQCVLNDNKNRAIVPRQKEIIPRWRYYRPYGEDLENHCLQILLFNFPFTRETIKPENLFSEENESKTYAEECIIRGIDMKSHSKEMAETAARRGYNEYRLRKLLQALANNDWITEDEIDGIIEGVPFLQPKDDEETETQSYGENVTPINWQIVEDEKIDPIIKHNYFNENEKKMTLMNLYSALSPSQKEVFKIIEKDLIKNEQCFYIVGGEAGTGKTHVINILRKAMDYYKLNYATLATTGVAASNLETGRTIHSFFGLDFELNCYLEHNNRNSYYVSNVDSILIDEFSMLEVELFRKIEITLRTFPRPHEYGDEKKYFGGRSIILFGDPAQLPAIGLPIFCSTLFDKFKILLLKENHRQTEDKIYYQILKEARIGYLSDYSKRKLKERIVEIDKKDEKSFNKIEKGPPILVSRIVDRDWWNNKILDTINDEEVVFNAKTYYDGNEDKLASESELTAIKLNCKEALPETLKLKKGAQVMLLRNLDVKGGWANGRIARVKCIKEDSNAIIIFHPDRGDFIVEKVRQTLKIPHVSVVFKREQFPLILSWATTIHKIQGVTLDRMYLQLGKLFSSGQGYVALSRVKTLKGLTIIKWADDQIFLDDKYKEVLTWFENADRTIKKDHYTPFPEELRQKFIKNDSTAFAKKLKEELLKAAETIRNEKDKKEEEKTIKTHKPKRIFIPRKEITIADEFRNHIDFSMSILKQLQENRFFEFNPALILLYLNKEITRIQSAFNRIRNLTLQYFDSSKNSELDYLKDSIHPAVYSQLVPVFTNGGGDCFYNSVSICLCNSEALMPVLRLLTTYMIAKNYYIYQQSFIIPGMDESVDRFLLSAATPGLLMNGARFSEYYNGQLNWAENFTIMATSHAINRPIYCFGWFGKTIESNYLKQDYHDTTISGEFLIPDCTTEEFQQKLNAQERGYMNHMVASHPRFENRDGIYVFHSVNHFMAMMPKYENFFKFKTKYPYFRDTVDYIDAI